MITTQAQVTAWRKRLLNQPDEEIMIPADRLKTLTSFTSAALSRALDPTGSKNINITDSTFLGITNGGQFCYTVMFESPGLAAKSTGKVFLNYEPLLGKITAIKDWR